MAIFYSPSEKGFYDSEIHITMPDDVVEITRSKWAELLEKQAEGNGIHYENGEFILVEPEAVISWDIIRKQRDQRLSKSDWTQLPDAPLSDDEKQAWAAYRDSLRNITEEFSEPEDVKWPVSPAD